MQTNVMDQCVRLAFAIILIALVSFGLYQIAGRASAYGPASPIVSLAP